VDGVGGVLNVSLKLVLDGLEHSHSVLCGRFGFCLQDAKRVAHRAKIRRVLHFQYERQRAVDDLPAQAGSACDRYKPARPEGRC
jgi:hypothetical protein